MIKEKNKTTMDDCLKRLIHLGELKDGWLEPQDYGKAINKNILTKVKELIIERPYYCHLFNIFPTEDGGILIELYKNNNDNWGFSIEFLSDNTIEIDNTSEEEFYQNISKIHILNINNISEKFLNILDKIIKDDKYKF